MQRPRSSLVVLGSSSFGTLPKLAAALPVVFVLHVAEEGPRFVPWFNSLVAPPISQRLFVAVNVVALVITFVVAILVAMTRDRVSVLVGVAWVGFLMLANGILHVAGTLVHGRYCPGVLTALLLYFPMSLLFMRAAVREAGLSPWAVLAVAILGGVPMYVHGYLIVFQGSRLF